MTDNATSDRTLFVQDLRAGLKTIRLFARIPTKLDAALRRAAELHGRPYMDEVRAALEVHVSRSILRSLQEAEIQEQLGAAAVEFEKARRADLRALEAETYRRPTPTSLLQEAEQVKH